MINQLIISYVLNIFIIASLVTGIKFSEAEIDQLLKKLNKPALKSIQSPDGDIIDCVHMKNHPIYDHHLLKNHTIQMRPSTHLERPKNERLDEEKKCLVTQLWTINGKCPENSIPIIRTKREDILRAKSIKRYGRKDLENYRHDSQSNLTHEYAIIKVRGIFHGAKGNINVWKPSVQVPREFSLAQIWLLAGPSVELNTIEFGWQVYPGRYNDANPRFFTYWTVDNYKRTGCYNLACSGFVLVSQEFALGGAVANVSILNGTQYEFLTIIKKDPSTKNWWLSVNHLPIGYWPFILFNHLTNDATNVHFGGEVLNFNFSVQHTTTKMGSGNFAAEGYRKTAYFRKLQIFDQESSWKPIREFPVSPFETKTTCYSLMRSHRDDKWGDYFFYGGPGRNRQCR